LNTLKELIEHIKKHKDAVIIIGSEVNKLKTEYTTEDFNEIYNRKNLKRAPEKLWDFYKDNILTEIDDNDMYKLIKEMDYALVVNQNINSPLRSNAFDIHGNVDSYMCPRCKTIYTSDYVNTEEDLKKDCELCGATIKPSVLLAGERYDQAQFDDLKEKLIATHTLILIGMDYTEQPLLDLVADYGDIKAQVNANGNPDDQKALVVIQTEEQEFNPNQITFCDFVVKGDIEDSLVRFMKEY
jgi:NAD-dependent SIR2 family protein deacetylase